MTGDAAGNVANMSAAVTNPPGILQVDSEPWSWVTVGGQKKETPDKFYLAPGTYTVQLYNEENGRAKTRTVTIEPGQLLKLNVEMDQ